MSYLHSAMRENSAAWHIVPTASGSPLRLERCSSGTPRPGRNPSRYRAPRCTWLSAPPATAPLGGVAVQWTPLYVSANPIDRNVFLETVKSDAEAAALILADRVACLGEQIGPGSGFGMIPKQAVAWADRDPAIPRRVIV